MSSRVRVTGPPARPTARPAAGAYVSCTAHTANDFKKAGLITAGEEGEIVAEAADSSCGSKK